MRILMVALGAVVLAGCSTTPVTETSAKPVPAERIYDKAIVGMPADSEASVSFLRDKGFYGSGCTHVIYVNNSKAFAIGSGEALRLHLKPGRYFFRLETGAGLCPNIATSQSTILETGAHEAYRILLPSDGSLRLTRVE